MPAGFSSTKPSINNKDPRIEDLIEVYKLPPKKWVRVRFNGPIWSYMSIWFRIKTNSGKIVSFPKMCLDYNPNTEECDSETCPYRASGLGRPSKWYVVNAIIRELQESEPKKKVAPSKSETVLTEMCGEKVYLKAGKKSSTWTPERALIIPASLAEQLKNYSELNKVKLKDGFKTFDIGHPKYGTDINLYHDPDIKGTAAYRAQKEERTPLTEEELKYPMWKLNVLVPEDLRKATKEMASLKPKVVEDDERENISRPVMSLERASKRIDTSVLEDLDTDSLEDLDEAPVKKIVKKKKVGHFD